MRIYPAIDIKDGKCVRLKQGSFDEVTIYNDDPAAQAVIWRDSGAEFIHVVDLDGARYGRGYNNRAIARVIAAVEVPTQVGGGIRSIEEIEVKLSMGAARVILGTAAVTDTGLLQTAVRQFGAERVVAGVDAKDGFTAISGWKSATGM
ncbi:MAG: 1-(5-phosphoribosyl)-5-((5-phosphoribosylamino)methylideneamino)imidazole-4-carboxamide isomerase, partial [Clostridiales bacterium]|nr:1-(5-phosphoribosyl)-5-((5-phosphoribosylamino)methylideneamino)imidazole-4-carboxamide isomerase [Clostridiales bacterium]